MKTTIMIIVYVISVILYYIFTKLIYSEKGKYKYLDPSYSDILITFLPFINTFALLYIINWKDDKYKDNFPNRFFGIKEKN